MPSKSKKVVFLVIIGILGTTFIIYTQPLYQTAKSQNYNQNKQVPLSQNSPTNIQIMEITPTPPNQLSIDKLQKYFTVQAALLGVDDNVSVYFKDFQTAKEISIDPTRSWIPASTIKAYVVLEAFKQKRLGLIHFDQTVRVKKENVVPTEMETDEFPRLLEDTVTTIKQLIETMITQSDNTAYNTLLDVLDRRNINATLKDIGITETVVGEKLNLDDDQFAIDVKVPGRQSNTTTVKDYATFFDLLYRKQIPDAEEILSIFKRQKINNMIPAFIPQDTIVAHKTGDLAPIYHDGGIIYKPDEPFLLTIFTKSNDPNVLAQLSKVAYYKTAAVVGQASATSDQKKKISENLNSQAIYLAQNYQVSNVLGASTNDKFPTVTADDLGITKEDLVIDKEDISKISDAKIIPGSAFYGLKKIFEKVKSVVAFTSSQKINVLSEQATNRLAEAKVLLQSGKIDEARKILVESEANLERAVIVMKEGRETDKSLPRLKQINDLHFATLAQVAINLDSKKKEQFIDMVYDFYQKNKKEVKPAITNSLVANPLKQQPIIGIVKEIKDNNVTLQFVNGPDKIVRIDDLTPVREFHKKSLDSDLSTLKPGSKIAIIGQTTNTGIIVPQFILRNVPKEIPDKREGVVLEINPKLNLLKILNKAGENEIIKLNSETKITSKNTSVSLMGIKAGSIITFFGETEKTSPTPTIKPDTLNFTTTPSATIQLKNLLKKDDKYTQEKLVTQTQNLPQNQEPAVNTGANNTKLSNSQSQISPQSGQSVTNTSNKKLQPPSSPTTKSSTNNPTVINATSITITNNASGKQEKSGSAKTSPTNSTTSNTGSSSQKNEEKKVSNSPPPKSSTDAKDSKSKAK